MTDAVLVETDADGVRTLTFNRPDRRNGWSSDLEDAYYDALSDAAADPAVRAVVVTGAGTTFCPGADMARLGGLSAEGASLPHHFQGAGDFIFRCSAQLILRQERPSRARRSLAALGPSLPEA